jgi:hypothetical protein
MRAFSKELAAWSDKYLWSHMPHPASSFAYHTSPAQAGKVKTGCLVDIGWGRPVFKAPDLPSPRVIFDPLPFRSAFSGGQRQAAGR